MKLDLNKLTLSEQIANALRSQIQNDQFYDGKLPKEESLAKELNISRGTVRSAMAILEKEDLIIRIKKKGTFVKGSNQSFQNLKRIRSLNLFYHGTYKSFEIQNRPGFFGYAYNAILAEANRQNFNINLVIIENLAALENCLKFKSDGNIIFGIGNKKIIEGIVSTKKPCVLVDHLHEGVQCVNIDSFQGSAEAVKYLHGRGHRKFIFMDYKNNYLNPDRSHGVMETLHSCNIRSKNIIRVFSGSGNKKGYQCTEELMKDGFPKGFTAMVIYNSEMAFGVINALQDNQLRVPQDISIISCGNISEVNQPLLSTVDFDLNYLGKLTIDHLSAIINKSSSIQPNIAVRGFVSDRGSVRDLRE